MDSSGIQIFIKEFTETRFAVEVRSFCAKANELLKSINGFQYDSVKRLWTFPIDCKEQITEELKKEFDVIIM